MAVRALLSVSPTGSRLEITVISTTTAVEWAYDNYVKWDENLRLWTRMVVLVYKE